jgi:hypothetical protein
VVPWAIQVCGGGAVKVEMSGDGVLTISAENGAEAFALRYWLEKSTIKTHDLQRDLDRHFDPRWISIRYANPLEKSE